MYVVGLDIGYSNVKIVYGDTTRRSSNMVMPAVSAPASYASFSMIGEEDRDPIVRVNGEQWVAGIQPSRIEGWSRVVHDNYTDTDGYYALFLSAMSATGVSYIDRVVTGLPVAHYTNFDSRAKLINQLTGTHVGVGGHKFEIGEVKIVPQPMGSFMSLVSTYEDSEVIEEGKVLVIDPGFFSVDWLVINRMRPHMSTSGTSMKAMSKLIERTAGYIEEQYGEGVSQISIETALRSGRDYIFHYGQRVSITEPIRRAASEESGQVLSKIKSSKREDNDAIDIVLLAGGGASLYKEAAEENYSRSRIILPDDPVMSNAQGFWFLGI